MKLEKAIEILGKHGVVDEETTWGDYLKAVMLGKEAMKRTRDSRKAGVFYPDTLLPGEDKE